ncbi:MAG: hypothetical protein Q4A69_04920 [Moraxella sp.]|nr:hypothetical protein [Moraxella sp.]
MYHFIDLLIFVVLWTLVALFAILIINQYVNVRLAQQLGHQNSYWLSVLIILVLFAGIGYHGWLKMGWLGVLVGVPLVWLACSKLTSKPLLIPKEKELKAKQYHKTNNSSGNDSGSNGSFYDSGSHGDSHSSGYAGGGGDFGGGGGATSSLVYQLLFYSPSI